MAQIRNSTLDDCHVITFVDVEGTKEVKRMINLLAITVNLYHEIDADPSGSGSKTDRVRK